MQPQSSVHEVQHKLHPQKQPTYDDAAAWPDDLDPDPNRSKIKAPAAENILSVMLCNGTSRADMTA
jgi:hypothetical protein